eukprot:GHVU01222217.1.p1 GENE.GHVU01222217.1~~GHVU01222217.1.p1  ORF type:complete len:112 (-),score=1.84 GHVU01222217.1:98-433(-)
MRQHEHRVGGRVHEGVEVPWRRRGWLVGREAGGSEPAGQTRRDVQIEIDRERQTRIYTSARGAELSACVYPFVCACSGSVLRARNMLRHAGQDRQNRAIIQRTGAATKLSV